MTGLWTMAGLTLKEASRKRLFLGGLLIALLFVAMAFLPLHVGQGLNGQDLTDERLRNARIFAWLGCGMIKFFSSILAVSLAAGAITAEVERGVLSTVVPKPIPRASIYLGKWLGFLILLAMGLAIWGGLLALAIFVQTHVFMPRIFLGVLATGLFPLLFTTLTLFFSTRAAYGLSAGLALIAAGVALAEDMLRGLSFFLSAPILGTLAKIVGLIVPLSRMNHWITRGLGGAGLDLSDMTREGPNLAAVATTGGDLAYVLGYIGVTLAVGLWLFQKRDL